MKLLFPFVVLGLALLVWAGEPLTKQQAVSVLEIELHAGQTQSIVVTGQVLPDSITVWLTTNGKSTHRVYRGRPDTATAAR